MNTEAITVKAESFHGPVPTADSVLRRLGDFEAVTARLDASVEALHAYELEAREGNLVRVGVSSEAFHVVAFLVLSAPARTAPGDATFSKVVPGLAPGSGAGAVSTRTPTGGVESLPPVLLPFDGVYRIIVTSIENQAAGRGVSTGEYRMTLLVDGPSAEPPVDSERGTRFSAWESDSH